MRPASDYELALSMMRLWGKNAKSSARTYALNHCRNNNLVEFRKWHAVERIIEQMQVARESCADADPGYHAQRPVAIDRRVGWLEAMAGLVMPALQRLGSAAIRGAGR